MKAIVLTFLENRSGWLVVSYHAPHARSTYSQETQFGLLWSSQPNLSSFKHIQNGGLFDQSKLCLNVSLSNERLGLMNDDEPAAAVSEKVILIPISRSFELFASPTPTPWFFRRWATTTATRPTTSPTRPWTCRAPTSSTMVRLYTGFSSPSVFKSKLANPSLDDLRVCLRHPFIGVLQFQ